MVYFSNFVFSIHQVQVFVEILVARLALGAVVFAIPFGKLSHNVGLFDLVRRVSGFHQLVTYKRSTCILRTTVRRGCPHNGRRLMDHSIRFKHFVNEYGQEDGCPQGQFGINFFGHKDIGMGFPERVHLIFGYKQRRKYTLPNASPKPIGSVIDVKQIVGTYSQSKQNGERFFVFPQSTSLKLTVTRQLLQNTVVNNGTLGRLLHGYIPFPL